MQESGFDFTFSGDALKFDETEYYKQFKSYMPNGKGVDFLSKSPDSFLLMEVKNCLNYEQENIWRTKTDYVNEDGEESFDIEVAKKVECTLACLVGARIAYSLGKADELKPYFEAISSPKFERGQKSLKIILFLEGDFKSKTRSKKMIMKRIQEKIAMKMKWLNCIVRVVDLSSYNSRDYGVVKCS